MASDDLRPPEKVIAIACNVAALSSCRKSKRGAVIFRRTQTGAAILSSAHNSPPWPYECDGSEACRRCCRDVAVHAEQRALLELGEVPWRERPQLELVHVKVKAQCEGGCGHEPLRHLVTSGPPSCAQCSKLVLEARIGAVWLFEDTEVALDGGSAIGVWNRYDTQSFHRITLRVNGLHIHI